MLDRNEIREAVKVLNRYEERLQHAKAEADFWNGENKALYELYDSEEKQLHQRLWAMKELLNAMGYIVGTPKYSTSYQIVPFDNERD